MSDVLDELADVLAKMRFVSEAAGANLEQEAASANADRSPKFNGASLYEDYLRDVEELVKRGQQKLHRAQHSPRPPVDQQKAYREHIIKEHAGRSVREAAAIEKVSPAYIQQVRDEARKAGKRGSTQ